MSSSRRRFLVAVGAALLAGCNESSQSSRDGTVTPVDVPQSDDDALETAAQVAVPAVPPGVVVGDDHREAVIEHAEGLVDRAARELEAAGGVDLADIEVIRNREDPFEAARQVVEELREGPDPRPFRRLDREFADVGAIVGYVRAETGELDTGAVRAAFRTERDGYADLTAGLEYRVATPVIQFLPTVAAAEGALEHAGNRLDTVEEAVGGLGDEPGTASSSELAVAWRRVEQVRLAKANAAGFLGTATDPSATARETELEDELERQRRAIRSLELPAGPDGSAGPVPERMRTILSTVRSRRSDVLDGAGRDVPSGPTLVEALLRVVRVRGEVEAFGTAASLTFDRMDGGGIAEGQLVEEKRHAVERLETLAGAAPLQRRVGSLAEDMVTFGDRLQPGQGTDPVATAHFVYVGAQEFADRALTRGEALADSLGDPDGLRE